MFKKNIEIDKSRLPQHIAFIMDGNGRWATRRLLPRNAGHKAGVSAVKKVIDNALEMGIKYLTFYAFSTENWKRPKDEINGLFDIFREFIKDCRDVYKGKDIRLIPLGDITRFPEDMAESIRNIAEETKDCKKMCVCIAFNYGSRYEIARAFRLMKESGAEITEENIKNYLYTKDIPDPDLIVRTAGEKRLSNFLLYQAAYSEFYFTDTCWPDFDKGELLKAIKEYGRRTRKFGNAV